MAKLESRLHIPMKLLQLIASVRTMFQRNQIECNLFRLADLNNGVAEINLNILDAFYAKNDLDSIRDRAVPRPGPVKGLIKKILVIVSVNV